MRTADAWHLTIGNGPRRERHFYRHRADAENDAADRLEPTIIRPVIILRDDEAVVSVATLHDMLAQVSSYAVDEIIYRVLRERRLADVVEAPGVE